MMTPEEGKARRTHPLADYIGTGTLLAVLTLIAFFACPFAILLLPCVLITPLTEKLLRRIEPSSPLKGRWLRLAFGPFVLVLGLTVGCAWLSFPTVAVARSADGELYARAYAPGLLPTILSENPGGERALMPPRFHSLEVRDLETGEARTLLRSQLTCDPDQWWQPRRLEWLEDGTLLRANLICGMGEDEISYRVSRHPLRFEELRSP